MILDLELHTLAQIYDDRPPSTQKMSRKEPDTAASLGHIPHMRQQEYTASHLVGPDRRHQIDQFHDHGIAHVCPKIGHLVQICKHILATQHGSSSTSNAHPRHRPKPQLLSSYVARDLICLQPATGGHEDRHPVSLSHSLGQARHIARNPPPPPPPQLPAAQCAACCHPPGSGAMPPRRPPPSRPDPRPRSPRRRCRRRRRGPPAPAQLGPARQAVGVARNGGGVVGAGEGGGAGAGGVSVAASVAPGGGGAPRALPK